MSQVEPQLSVYGRWLLVQRVMSGRPVAHVAAEPGVSRATGYKWWDRWRTEGIEGLQNRSSRPRTSPTRTSEHVEQQVLALRRERTEALPDWLHTYNHHRADTALGGRPPISRIAVNNLTGHYG